MLTFRRFSNPRARVWRTESALLIQLLDGLPELAKLTRLVEKELRPAFQTSLPVLGVAVVCQYNDHGRWNAAFYFPHNVHPVAAWRMMIQDHDIRPERLNGGWDFGMTVDVPEHFDLGCNLGNHGSHAFSQDRGVVY